MAIASRLRSLASQCSAESQLLDRAGTSRRRLVGVAIQLGYQARSVAAHPTVDADLHLAWIDEATNVLVAAIMARTEIRVKEPQ
jgi:hypothetical protein